MFQQEDTTWSVLMVKVFQKEGTKLGVCQRAEGVSSRRYDVEVCFDGKGVSERRYEIGVCQRAEGVSLRRYDMEVCFDGKGVSKRRYEVGVCQRAEGVSSGSKSPRRWHSVDRWCLEPSQPQRITSGLACCRKTLDSWLVAMKTFIFYGFLTLQKSCPNGNSK